MTAHDGIRVRLSGGPRVITVVSEMFATPQPPAWQEEGICQSVDPEAWFPEKGGNNREAKAICLSCPVVDECLEYALSRGERFGIWGAKSERERRKLERERRSDDSGQLRCRICGLFFRGVPKQMDCSAECRVESRRRRTSRRSA